MATSLLKSFIEVVNPAVVKAGKRARDPPSHKAERKSMPQAGQAVLQAEPSLKQFLRFIHHELVLLVMMWVKVPAAEGENVLEVSGEEIPSLELADQIAVCRWIPVTEPNSMSVDTSSTAMSMSMPQSQCEAEDSGLEQGDIVHDAQFFQETATEYQLAYQSLDEKYTHQAVLVKEASEALKASESHVSELQEELMTLKCNREADI